MCIAHLSKHVTIMLTLLLAAALILAPGWTQADISGTDPPSSSCLCTTVSSVFVRDAGRCQLPTEQRKLYFECQSTADKKLKRSSEITRSLCVFRT